MNIKKILIFFIIIFLTFSNVVAAEPDTKPATSLNDAFSKTDFLFKGDGGIGDEIKEILRTELIPLLGKIGNTVFAVVTVFLGIKYIYANSNTKAVIKDSLPNYLIGVVFFYLAFTIVSFLAIDQNDPSKLGIIAIIFPFSGSSYDDISDNILATVATIVNFASIMGLVILGIKYMVSSAEGKAEFKQSLTGVVIGLAFAFCAGSIVNLIIGIGKGILP